MMTDDRLTAGPAPTRHDSSEAAIRARVPERERAQQRERPEDLLALFAPQAVWVTGDGRRLLGRAEIADSTRQIPPT